METIKSQSLSYLKKTTDPNTQDILRYLLSIQEERAKIYNKFHVYFKKYISVDPILLPVKTSQSDEELVAIFQKFRTMCNQIAQLFNFLTVEIRNLKSLNISKSLFQLIDNLQCREEAKFKLVWCFDGRKHFVLNKLICPFKTIEYYLTEYEYLTKQNDDSYDHHIAIGKLNALKKE